MDVDLLKKRADRFGTVRYTSNVRGLYFENIDQATSTALKKAEVSEAIKRRQERFGVITADEPKVSPWSLKIVFVCHSPLSSPRR